VYLPVSILQLLYELLVEGKEHEGLISLSFLESRLKWMCFVRLQSKILLA
jgi:hypothetical protein